MALAVTGVSAQTMMGGPGGWGPGNWDTGSCGPGGRGFGYARTNEQIESVKQSGRLVLTAGELPTLSVGNTDYTLRIHPAITNEVELKSGQTITVEGDLVEVTSRDLMTTYRIIHVTALESGGTRVIAPDTDFYGPGAGYGRHGGRGGRQSDGTWRRAPNQQTVPRQDNRRR